MVINTIENAGRTVAYLLRTRAATAGDTGKQAARRPVGPPSLSATQAGKSASD